MTVLSITHRSDHYLGSSEFSSPAREDSRSIFFKSSAELERTSATASCRSD